MFDKELIKLQKGGSLKDLLKKSLELKQSSTYVKPAPKLLTEQEASDQKDARARQLYERDQVEKDRKLQLKRRGQTNAGNLVNDMGTNMLTLTTQFRTPSQAELEKGRNGWSDRANLLMNATSHGLVNEMTGGAMNWVGNKVASGEAKVLAENLAKKLKGETTTTSGGVAAKKNPNIIEKVLNKIGDTVEDGVRFIDNETFYKLRNRKEIPLIKKRTEELLAENKLPESINRMNYMKIDADLFNKITPEITVKSSRIGSHYSFTKDKINIDADQLKKFMKTDPTLTVDAVIDHEIGHRYQGFRNINMMKPKEGVMPGDTPKYPGYGQMTMLDRSIRGFNVKEGLKGRPAENRDYVFDNNLEPTSHLMETRRGMIEKGVLESRHEKIMVPKLRKYFKENPTDRINSFMENNPRNYELLKQLLNYLPAAGVAGGASIALQEDK